MRNRLALSVASKVLNSLVLAGSALVAAPMASAEIIGDNDFTNNHVLTYSSAYLIGVEVTLEQSGEAMSIGARCTQSGITARYYLYKFTGTGTDYQMNFIAATDPFQTTGNMMQQPLTLGTKELEPGRYLIAFMTASNCAMQTKDNNGPYFYSFLQSPTTTPPAQMTPSFYDGNEPVKMFLEYSSGGRFAHSCLSSVNGRVNCWGDNARGQLGLGNSQSIGDEAGEMGAALMPAILGDNVEVTQVLTGGSHSCALSKDKRVKCWGANQHGQLGYGDTQARGMNPQEMGNALKWVDLGANTHVEQIALGDSHTCALLSSGGVKCWGLNKTAQLGLGDTANRGDRADHMGDALIPINLGTNLTAKSIAAGKNHTCALLSNDTVKCWGDGSKGQLGSGAASMIGAQAGQMGDVLAAVAFGEDLTPLFLTTGDDTTCILFTNGKIKCFGNNSKGQLGIGDTATVRGTTPAEMGASLPFVNLGNQQMASSVSCGGSNCCATLLQNTLKCWGDNSKGQLGLGDLEDRGSTPLSMGDDLPAIEIAPLAVVDKVIVKRGYICARERTRGYKCWGDNSMGQLGLGDTSNRGETPDSIPLTLPFLETN